MRKSKRIYGCYCGDLEMEEEPQEAIWCSSCGSPVFTHDYYEGVFDEPPSKDWVGETGSPSTAPIRGTKSAQLGESEISSSQELSGTRESSDCLHMFPNDHPISERVFDKAASRILRHIIYLLNQQTSERNENEE